MKMLQRMDYIATIFKGIFTWQELMDLPIYMFDYIVAARFKQLEESQKQYEKTGHMNVYMQQPDANSLLMSIGGGLSGANSRFKPEDPDELKGFRREKTTPKKHFTQRDFHKQYINDRAMGK